MGLESEANGSTPPTAARAVETLAESVAHTQLAGLNEPASKDANPKAEKSDLSVTRVRATIIAELAKKIRPKLGSEMPEAVQAELATLLGLVPEAIRRTFDQGPSGHARGVGTPDDDDSSDPRLDLVHVHAFL
jgi:hypothetical protein